MYEAAIANGIWVEDGELLAQISNLRSKIELADNYDDYLTFIQGTGMDEDEYWNSQLEVYRFNEIIQRNR